MRLSHTTHNLRNLQRALRVAESDTFPHHCRGYGLCSDLSQFNNADTARLLRNFLCQLNCSQWSFTAHCDLWRLSQQLLYMLPAFLELLPLTHQAHICRRVLGQSSLGVITITSATAKPTPRWSASSGHQVACLKKGQNHLTAGLT